MNPYHLFINIAGGRYQRRTQVVALIFFFFPKGKIEFCLNACLMFISALQFVLPTLPALCFRGPW